MNETGRPQDFPLSNPRADRVRKVAQLAGRPARLKRREFLAEGPQAVREALTLHQKRIAAGEPGIVYEVYASESCLDRHPDLETLAEGTDATSPPTKCSPRWRTPSPRRAFSRSAAFLDVSLEQVLDAGPQLIAVLCQVRDPGNAGTVLRAADAAGADAVILTGSSVDIYNPKAVRSTAGSLFHLPVVLGADVEDLVARCRARGIGVLAADGYGQLNLDRLQDENAARRLGSIRGRIRVRAGERHCLAVRQRSPGPVRGRAGAGRPPRGRSRLRRRRKPEPGNGGHGVPVRQCPIPAARPALTSLPRRRPSRTVGTRAKRKAGAHQLVDPRRFSCAAGVPSG